MRVQWIGGATALLEAGPFRLLTDPVFAEGDEAFLMPRHPSTGRDEAIARLAPLPAFDLLPLDAVLVSHVHPGHLDTLAVARLPKETPVVAPGAHAEGLRRHGFTRVTPLDWWQRTAIRRGEESLRLLALPAWHSADPVVSLGLGVVNGYLVEHVAAGTRRAVAWTGDTVWFEGLRLVAERIRPVDLLLPHMGAVGQGGPWGRMTLDAAEGSRLVEVVDAAAVVPLHHHTFSHYVEPIERLRERLAGTPCEGRLHVLAEGEALSLP